MTVQDVTERQAELLGREHGVAAASWFFDGNTRTETYEAVLQGIVVGDPEVLDSFPGSPLSGEWADSFSLRDLADELGVDEGDDSFDDYATAYEDGFHSAVQSTIESACLDYLKGAEG